MDFGSVCWFESSWANDERHERLAQQGFRCFMGKPSSCAAIFIGCLSNHLLICRRNILNTTPTASASLLK
jgi:hypothetical protein